MQLCDVAQASVKTLDIQLGRRRDDFQVHRKSRLPGQMSRRVEKPPACGRFGLVLVSYRPLDNNPVRADCCSLRRT